MKRIINHTTILATLLIATGSLYARDGFAPRDEKTKGTLKAAVNQMVASIEHSLGIFEGLNRSQREKIAEFDNILSQIQYSITVTAADGALHKKIGGAVNLAHQQSEWCKTTAKNKKDERLADRYRELGKIADEKAVKIQKNAELVLSVNGELAELLPQIQDEKGLFYAAAVIGDLELANKSLVDVQRNMKTVVGLLKQLNTLDNQFNVPAPVFAQR